MSDAVLIAVISAIGLVMSGVLVELMRARRATNAVWDELKRTVQETQTVVHDMDKRLVSVETSMSYMNRKES